MHIHRIALSIGIAASLLACGPSQEKQEALEKAAALEHTAMVSSSADVQDQQDSLHQFIRKADLKFKVKNVVHSSYDIENSVRSQNGFVTSTKLNSEISSVTTIPISADSLLETTRFTVTNVMHIRVPNTKLDTTLRLIARNVQFLDSRVITAEDMALQLKANKLEQKRLAKSEARLAQSLKEPEKKLKEKTAAEELLSKKEERHDEVLINHLSLQDEINYSTIDLFFYQNETMQTRVIAQAQNQKAFEPSFGMKLLESCKEGWSVLQVIILFFVKIWPLFLFAGIAFVLVRKFGR